MRRLSRLFPISNSSFFLCSGNALQSSVLCFKEEMFLVDANFETPRICMQEYGGIPGSSGRLGESLIKEKILEKFFINLVAGESLIKERGTTRFNDLMGSTDVVAKSKRRLFSYQRRFHYFLLFCRRRKRISYDQFTIENINPKNKNIVVFEIQHYIYLSEFCNKKSK
ncbi:hypothetical protein R3W88_029749 [Solanum pinnatisectum]|uniref:Uncharacterized protein n=1 Tax=Solanum pinnatisectum TaxID=50273 RepID=A0AAV9K678_9SOLN|nr:hypothetical protein R3W88_029749 [Solanum pinnatisectum]